MRGLAWNCSVSAQSHKGSVWCPRGSLRSHRGQSGVIKAEPGAIEIDPGVVGEAGNHRGLP
jgi:hypothetical protein